MEIRLTKVLSYFKVYAQMLKFGIQKVKEAILPKMTEVNAVETL